MNSSTTWLRIGPAAGAAGALVYTVSAFTAGTPLKPNASVASITSHLAAHRSGALAGFLLAAVAVAVLLFFLGSLREFLAHEGGSPSMATVTTSSWVALLVIALVGAAPLVAVVWRGTRQVDPGIVRLAFDLSNLSLYALSAPAALISVLAPSVVIWRTGVLPRWLAILGGVEIVVNIIELAGLFTRNGFDQAGYAGGFGPFIWVIWVAAISIAMVMRTGGHRVRAASGRPA